MTNPVYAKTSTSCEEVFSNTAVTGNSHVLTLVNTKANIYGIKIKPAEAEIVRARVRVQ
jgi:hypothetical protein